MNITLSYQPLHLFPPFAYAAVMKACPKDSNISVVLDIEYVGREGMTMEELSQEGFTLTDDFHWKGTLDIHWKMDVESFINMDVSEEPHTDTYLHIEVDGHERGFPEDIGSADVIFQELMQAILEQSEIEAPLHLACDLNGELYDCTWFFASRSIEINGELSKKWEAGRELLKTIFSVDFESSEARNKPMKNAVMPGDDLWYHLKSSKIIERLNNQLRKLQS